MKHTGHQQDPGEHRPASDQNATRQRWTPGRFAARHPCQAQRDGGRGTQSTEQPGEQDAPIRSQQLDREITAEGNTGDQHHHHPESIRIQDCPGAITVVWQHRQQDHRNQEQVQGRTQLTGLQFLDASVQNRLEIEQQRRDDRTGRRQCKLPKPRQPAQAKRDQGCDGGGRARCVILPKTQQIGAAHHQRHRQNHRCGDDAAEFSPQKTRHTPQQPQQAEGAQAGDSLPFG